MRVSGTTQANSSMPRRRPVKARSCTMSCMPNIASGAPALMPAKMAALMMPFTTP